MFIFFGLGILFLFFLMYDGDINDFVAIIFKDIVKMLGIRFIIVILLIWFINTH